MDPKPPYYPIALIHTVMVASPKAGMCQMLLVQLFMCVVVQQQLDLLFAHWCVLLFLVIQDRARGWNVSCRELQINVI